MLVCLNCPLTIFLKWVHSNVTMIECQAHKDVLQLSHENEHEGQFAS